MPFPTVSNDMLPGNMIAFTMPVKAGPEGNMQFRYDPKVRNLYCDLNGEDGHGMPAQFDNVRINEKATDPQLQQIWELAASYRKMYDAEYAESIGEDVADEGEVSPEREAFSQESALPISERVAEVDLLPSEKSRHVVGQETPVAMMSDEAFSASDEFFTKDMMVATTQRENDRMVIRTLKQVIDQFIDPKEKILPIVATLVESNEDMYAKNFGGDDEPEL